MTQELVDKVRAYVKARREEIDNSPDPRQASIDHLKEIGYLDEKGEVAEQYRGGLPHINKKTKMSA
ncbi:hypothetical protein [Dyadobacter chenhuakuii]|uniref:Uncharacterized protein n=1 Tax=Dyadobacter chenhuakuii TaxID=2909339 RepID=A0ABY4XKN1_9BACT|nr:hypothetical protein [Dyadobacter chenhuakuii]MCF2493676.1 hypothetical protein [Dyadobacter chenhuakuii]USJ30811.1 hypothetical protein NFI80_23505 [Dyadobacter chenhuakuii]